MRFPEFALRPQSDLTPRLEALRERPLNFDPDELGGPGWGRDDYREELPPEEPGAPRTGGSWELAKGLSSAYAFADPSLVEAAFDPSPPLEGRDMLLVLHALGARIYAGVRVNAAGEETRVVDGSEARVAFWSYRTLEGHVEAGQRDFEVWKSIDTGRVEFRTHSISRPAESNALVRIGFLLLGRHKQVEFGRRACKRMALLTEAALRNRTRRPPTRLENRLLAIYVRDHHTLLVAARELAGRIVSGAPDAGARSFAAELRTVVEDDLAQLESLLLQLDSVPPRVRAGAAAVAERLGRLKLNGRLLSRSPLSAVYELEGCTLLLESLRGLWSDLGRLGVGPRDAAEREARAARLQSVAAELRAAAFDGATGSASSGEG